MPRPKKPAYLLSCFNQRSEVTGLLVMMHMRFPLSLGNLEDQLFERGINIGLEMVRFWRNRFGPMVAATFADTVSSGCGGSSIGTGTSTRCV